MNIFISMNKLLNEIRKIRGIINEGETETYLNKIKDILTFNDIMTPSIESNLNSITLIGDEKIIDYELMERGLKKVLLFSSAIGKPGSAEELLPPHSVFLK